MLLESVPPRIIELPSLADLHAAWLQAARGKRQRPDVAAFERRWPDSLLEISMRLRIGDFQPSGYRTFVFAERGKRRLISAAPFADRVIHHGVTQLIEPIWEARFVGWSFANRLGRGTHAALARARLGASGFRWALTLDVQRFFPSVDHEVLLALIARHVGRGRLFEIVRRIVASGDGILRSEWKPVLFPGDDLLALARPKGMPIGNQTSQFFANVYLHPLDLFVAHQIKPGLAARYVDDLVLFDRDRGRLHDARERIEEKLAALRLKAHPRKTRLWDVREGLPFLGYRVFPWGAKLPRATVTRFRGYLRAIAESYADGAIDLAGARQRISGLIGHARPASADAVLAKALDDHPLVRAKKEGAPR
jgi:RNA-directed DNA polymerase